MDYNNFFEIAKKEGINQIEIKEEEEIINSIIMFNENIERYQIDNNKHIKIKAIYDDKTVNISILQNEFDIKKIIDKIKFNAKYIENNDKDELLIDNSHNNKVEFKINNFDYENISKKLVEYNKYKKEYSLLKDIEIRLENVNEKIKIVNTNGVNLEDTNTYFCVLCSLISQDKDKLSTSTKIRFAKTYDELELDKVIIEAIKESVDKLNCSKITSNKYNILLNNSCVSDILSTISSIFMADNIQNDKSILCGKLNKLVFSNKITIVEDPTNDSLVGKRIFDDEGVQTSYKEIIKDGVFKTPLYNIKTALKDNTVSTGNGYGNISFRNMYILPSNSSYEELLKKLDNGIIIDSVEGMHAAINQINGNINLQAQGYIVNNGKKVSPIKLFTITTNIFELLTNVEMIGNDLHFTSVNCGSPSLLLNDISISS